MSLTSESKLEDVIDYQFSQMRCDSKDLDLKIKAHKCMKSTEENLVRLIEKAANEYYSTVATKAAIERLLQEQKAATSELEEIQRQVDHKMKAKQIVEQKRDLKMNYYNLYAKSLGLKIEPITGKENKDDKHLSFIFNCNNKSDHQETYSFNLMTDGKVYHVSNCCPQIEDMDKLLAELNKSNDLSAFILKVRRRFNAIALSG